MEREQFIAPYAGKIEARIGGSRESENDKLRLDIGASIDILSSGAGGPHSSQHSLSEHILPRFSVGADFFTWTRLRSAGGFKFPVEAVDYYFGVNTVFWQGYPYDGLEARLRLAHISAHLVDGDPSFTDPDQQYITYSREFIDLMVGNREPIDLSIGSRTSGEHPALSFVRPYLGALWMFHSLPDTLGTLTPYLGVDYALQPSRSVPIVLRVGYEARLNTELESIGEHQFRLGLKLGDLFARGVLVEGSYYAGRSQYGQHFHRREEYFSLGFSVDY